MSSWQHQSEASWPRRKKDHQVLFVVRYRDQPDAYMRVPPALANFGASPPVLELRCSGNRWARYRRAK